MRWDAVVYLQVVISGYSNMYLLPEFPLYPSLVWFVSYLSKANPAIVGILISNALFFASMILLFNFVHNRFGDEIASWTVIFASFFPSGIFYTTAQSESLYLFLSLLSFWLASRSKIVSGSIFGFLSALTRAVGISLIVPLTIYPLKQRAKGRGLRILVGLVAPAAGTALFAVYAAHKFGSSVALAKGVLQLQVNTNFGLPLNLSDWNGFLANLVRSYRFYLFPSMSDIGQTFGYTLAAWLIPISLSLAVLSFRRLSLAEGGYALVVIAVPLILNFKNFPLFFAMTRYISAAFPIYITTSVLLSRHPWIRLGVVVISGAAMMMVAMLFAQWYNMTG